MRAAHRSVRRTDRSRSSETQKDRLRTALSADGEPQQEKRRCPIGNATDEMRHTRHSFFSNRPEETRLTSNSPLPGTFPQPEYVTSALAFHSLNLRSWHHRGVESRQRRLGLGSELGTCGLRNRDSAKFFDKKILRISPSGSIFCEHCSPPQSSNSNVFNILQAGAEK